MLAIFAADNCDALERRLAVDSWGTKWTLLEIPLVDAVALLALKWVFTGMSGKYDFGSRITSNPEGFLYHCWLIVSLFLCVLEMLMLAQGFHTVAGGPRFLLLALSGTALLLLLTWSKKKNKVFLILESVGFLLMIVSIL